MKMHVLIRFGKWREIIDLPLPFRSGALLRDDGDVALRQGGRAGGDRNMRGGGGGGAACSRGASARVPPSRYVFNNTCLDILAVAEAMMRGEIEYRKGNHDAAFAHLRQCGRARRQASL